MGPDEAFRRTNVGRLLIRAFNAFETYHVRRLNEEGFPDFTPSDTRVLRNVEKDGGSRITDIARRARITPQAVSQLVGGLENRGYVVTAPDPDDGRARRVHLTDRGLALIARGQAITADLYEEWGGILGEVEFAQLQALLERLLEALAPADEALG